MNKRTLFLQLFTAAFLSISFSMPAFAQEYLDADRRYMKLTEISVDNTYGYDSKNPVKVGPHRKAITAYLNSLKLTDKDKFHLGTLDMDHKGEDGLVMVTLVYERKKEKTIVYLLTTIFEQPKALMGFSFKTIADIPKVIVFPADSIVKVKTCSDNRIYIVEDAILKETFGEAPGPSQNPSYKGGAGELKKYFAANPLTDENAKQVIFRVSIAFLVSCEGKAGDFEIITKGKGELTTYANQVLAIVNRMPQKWEPAKVDGKPVDCYQVLSFTVSEGQLNKFVYR
jgi:hypothetical protein